MTAVDLLDITDATTLRRAASAAWDAGNNAGEGFGVGYEAGDEDANINGLSAECGRLVLRADVDTDVAIYEAADGSVVLVGDANGPWAVRVR